MLTNETLLRRELLEVIASIAANDTKPEQMQRLDAILAQDPRFASFVAEAIWLLEAIEELALEDAFIERNANEMAIGHDDQINQVISSMNGAPRTYKDALNLPKASSWFARQPKWYATGAVLAASLAFICWVLGLGRSGQNGPHILPYTGNPDAVAGALNERPGGNEVFQLSALLKSATNCRWQPGYSPLEVGSGVKSGQSIGLAEGIASFQCTSGILVQMEGPSVLDLTESNELQLNSGMASFVLPWEFSTDCIHLPNVSIAGNRAELACLADGERSEVHCFAGSLRIYVPHSGRVIKLRAGESVTIRTGSTAEPVIDFGDAEEGNFSALRAKMERLAIPAEYVSSILKNNPLAYWRFEKFRDDGDKTLVDNEMGSKYPLCVQGTVLPVSEVDNQSIRIGLWGREGYLFVEDPIVELASDSYSFECWVRVLHQQYSTVLALIEDSDFDAPESTWRNHAMLLETGHPEFGLCRFLHRNPPSNRWQDGVNCTTTSPFTVGNWHYLVVVKDKELLQFYMDGKLECEGNAPADPLPENLSLLVGRPHKPLHHRVLQGQIDEIALYLGALKAEEIRKRFDMVQSRNQQFQLPTSEVLGVQKVDKSTL